jgi:hypothetical protein
MSQPKLSPKAIHKKQSLWLYAAIQKLAPRSLKSTYQVSDLVHDVFLDYQEKDPEYFKVFKEVDLELLKKLIYHRKYSNDRPKYRVHRTAQYDAKDLELISRNRVILEDTSSPDSLCFQEIQKLATAYLLSRGLESVFEAIGRSSLET